MKNKNKFLVQYYNERSKKWADYQRYSKYREAEGTMKSLKGQGVKQVRIWFLNKKDRVRQGALSVFGVALQEATKK